jgi:predicted lipoprotein with Yx(FWY)xxD motif
VASLAVLVNGAAEIPSIPARWFGALLPKRRRGLAAAAIVITSGLFLAACGGRSATGGDTGPRTSASAGTTSSPAIGPSETASSSSVAADGGIVITTAPSDYGPMLFDQLGQAIYLFAKETTGRPDCYGECAIAWPPVLTTGTPQATARVRMDLLGTIGREDGATQVTYAGHPLYYYAHEDIHQVLCHNVTEFGGRWLVVTPEGTPAA